MKENFLKNHFLLKSFVNKLTIRERLLLLITGAILIYVLVDNIFMTSLQQEILQNQTENDNLQKQVDGILKEVNNLENSLSSKVSENERNQYVKLQATLNETNLTLQKLSADLLPAQKIPKLLEEMLHDLSGLILIDVQTNKNQRHDLKNSFYHYHIRLTLSGEYAQLFQYVKRIEALPYPIKWENMQYKVTQFPQADIVLNLYVVLIGSVNQPHEGNP